MPCPSTYLCMDMLKFAWMNNQRGTCCWFEYTQACTRLCGNIVSCHDISISECWFDSCPPLFLVKRHGNTKRRCHIPKGLMRVAARLFAHYSITSSLFNFLIGTASNNQGMEFIYQSSNWDPASSSTYHPPAYYLWALVVKQVGLLQGSCSLIWCLSRHDVQHVWFATIRFPITWGAREEHRRY